MKPSLHALMRLVLRMTLCFVLRMIMRHENVEQDAMCISFWTTLQRQQSDKLGHKLAAT